MYSSGVLLIALVTARTSSSDIEYAKKLVAGNGDVSSLADPSAGLWGDVVMGKLQYLASICIHSNSEARPNLAAILQYLSSMKSMCQVELVPAPQANAVIFATQFSSATSSFVVAVDQASR